MGTRAHHASAGQSPACCLEGKETKEKKKQDQTYLYHTTKDKNDTEGICAAESAIEFRRCESLTIVLVNALPSKNIFAGICSKPIRSYCQLFLFVRVTCDNCRGQRPPVQELAKFDGTRSQLQSAAALLFHFLPKSSLSKSFKNIYLPSPTHHDVETSGCVEKKVFRKEVRHFNTHWHNACRNHARSGFQKYVKFSCISIEPLHIHVKHQSLQQSALIDCASMTSSARCLSGPSMPATAWSKSL